ncbi:MAG: HAD family phosphatase [Anaerolineales bacterium]|nr:HAD family phosphatase [Anaerolineales bacterium]
MEKNKQIKALIFDFDGLILETEAPVYRSWCEVYEAFGLDLPLAEWGRIVGTAEAEHFNPLNRLEKLVGKPLDHDNIMKERRSREMEMINSQPVMPGVETYLRDAKAMGLKLGVASSSSRTWVEGHLKRLGLIHYFDCIRTSDDVLRTKPDPGLFILVQQTLKIEPEDAIVFEDSPNGIMAAKQAGIFCVAVPNEITRHLSIDHADMHLNSLEDMQLSALLSKVEGILKNR